MPTWSDRLRAFLRTATGRSSGVGTYHALRSMALGLDPATIQTPADEPWTGAAMAAMEIGLPDGIATIVAIADGTVSMYLSTGGGVIGAGEHAAVRDAGRRFRTTVAESRGLLQGADAFPEPEAGHVRFHARTVDHDYSGVATEAALRSGRHPLSTLYAAGQDLLTEIRLSTPP